MANTFGFVLCLVSSCIFMTAFAVPWSDCGSVWAKPNSVFVVGCADTGICELHKGVNATFGIDFSAKEDASGLKMLVYGHLAGTDIPFPIDNPNGCKDSNITCPVKNSQSYGYRNVIFVKNVFPSLTLVVKLKLVDQDSKVMICVEMPVKIVSSAAKAKMAMVAPGVGARQSKSNSIRQFRQRL